MLSPTASNNKINVPSESISPTETFSSLTVPASGDGISIVASMVEGAAVGNGRPLYWEFRRKPNESLMRAARWCKWKAVWLSEEDPVIELYDLESDIAEKNDVASGNPEVVKKIQQFMSAASN